MESRVRITYFLPITTANDRTACLRIMDELRTRRPEITGFTHSADDPPAFRGTWWSEDRMLWVPDHLVLLFVDRPGSLTDPAGILAFAHEIKSRIAQVYAQEESPQEEIWCTLEQIHRLP